MRLFDHYKAIKANCDYHLSSFRDVIADLEKNGRRNGMENPVAQVIVTSDVEKDQYNVCVLVCYKVNSDKYEQIKKDYIVYSFADMPQNLSSVLVEKKELKITFYQEDVQEFILNKDLDVLSGMKGLTSLLNEVLSKTSHNIDENLQLVIRDFILYKRVIVNLRGNDGNDNYITEFLVDEVVGIPDSELDKLNDNHEISLLIKH